MCEEPSEWEPGASLQNRTFAFTWLIKPSQLCYRSPPPLDHNSLSRRHDPQSSLQTCKTKKIDSCLSHIREESWRNTGKAATCFKGQPDINSGFLQQNWWVEPNLHPRLHFCSEAAAPVNVGGFSLLYERPRDGWDVADPPEVRGVDSKPSSTQQQ